MKVFVLTLLLSVPCLTEAQNQQIIDHLLNASMAAEDCQNWIPDAEKAFEPFAKANFQVAREVILDALAKIEKAQGAADAAFDQSRQAAKSIKKSGCPRAEAKILLAREHFKQARFELNEARQQVQQMELYWLRVKENAIERASKTGRDADVMMEEDWSKVAIGLFVNTAELALLHTYPELETGLLAAEEAQLSLCE